MNQRWVAVWLVIAVLWHFGCEVARMRRTDPRQPSRTEAIRAIQVMGWVALLLAAGWLLLIASRSGSEDHPHKAPRSAAMRFERRGITGAIAGHSPRMAELCTYRV